MTNENKRHSPDGQNNKKTNKAQNVEMVNEFKERLKREGEYLMDEVFPKKIVELDEYFQSLSINRVSDIHTDIHIPVPDISLLCDEQPSKKRRLDGLDENSIDINKCSHRGTPVMVLPNGVAPKNKSLFVITEKLKPIIRDLIDHTNTEDILGEARSVETESASYLDQISRYFLSRAKLVSKVAKYPHIEDYRQAVCELDEKEYIGLRLMTCELRNHYASLHDIVMKNIEKIKRPRSANTENLY